MNLILRSGIAYVKLLIAAICIFVISGSGAAFADNAPTITVFKKPSCGCCGKWVDHLKDNGFKVDVKQARSMAAIKKSIGLQPKLHSCHTAFLNRDGSAKQPSGDHHKSTPYIIEGHVPAKEIKRLLAEKPDIKGLTVPGMPAGSPGMEMEDGTKDKYDVLSFDEAGKTEIYSSY